MDLDRWVSLFLLRSLLVLVPRQFGIHQVLLIFSVEHVSPDVVNVFANVAEKSCYDFQWLLDTCRPVDMR